jgi:peptide/nickel transport system permease protein
LSFARFVAERTVLAVLAVLLGMAIAVGGFQLTSLPARSNSVARERVRAFVQEHPLYEDYGRAVWRLVAHGSLGTVRREERELEVRRVATDAGRVSISVAGGGLALAVVAAVPLGLAWSRWPSRVVRWPVRALSYVAASAFVFWVGTELAYYLGFRLELTPITGYCALDGDSDRSACGGLWEWTRHLSLPWVTLALPLFAVYVRVIRTSAARIRDERRTPSGTSARRHEIALFVRRLGVDFAFALGLAAFVEVIFGLPGFGVLLLEGVQQFDYVFLQGMLIATVLVAAAAHLVADLIAGVLDPERRGVRDY